MSDNTELYPEIEPYVVEFLKVSDLHSVAYEQVGNPQGTPVLFLHGGPGVGIVPGYRRYFDPDYFRVILLDQRGAGRSTPFSELRENTTWDIVTDLERLRRHLDIGQWIVMGGSWGSTLALCYAIEHPASVAGLILRGVFLARPSEIDWLHKAGGASNIYPDAWREYVSHVAPEERRAPLQAYYKMLTSEDVSVREKAAAAWSKWEASIMSLVPDQQEIDSLTIGDRSVSLARTECHYTVNGFFMPSSDFILENARKIDEIPCQIVQGRYDVVCPVRSAWDLYNAMPHSDLSIIQRGAHSASDGEMAGALVRAVNTFKI